MLFVDFVVVVVVCMMFIVAAECYVILFKLLYTRGAFGHPTTILEIFSQVCVVLKIEIQHFFISVLMYPALAPKILSVATA